MVFSKIILIVHALYGIYVTDATSPTVINTVSANAGSVRGGTFLTLTGAGFGYDSHYTPPAIQVGGRFYYIYILIYM